MQVRLSIERWPLARPFTIARETIHEVPTLLVELEADGLVGRGEAQGVDYRGETPETMVAELRPLVESGTRLPSRQDLLGLLAPGGARNALDVALWDLEAKRTGMPAWQLAGLPRPAPRQGCVTIGIDTPDAMAEIATASGAPILKLKLGAADGHDLDRATAVRAARPDATLLVDVNGGWAFDDLARLVRPLEALGVMLIEQPLPAGADRLLGGFASPIPLCADESFDTAADLHRLAGYTWVNIKLDKTGGLTAALEAARAARAAGFDIMLGNMVGTSLAMAPAFLLAPLAGHIDLDGPLLLARDRPEAIRYEGACMHPPGRALWG